MKFKYLLLLFIFFLFSFMSFSQESAPTLSTGSGTVAFNKGNLDVELITKIIAEKQKEIAREGIKRMIFKAIGNAQLDDYSQFYIERITEIIFQEKNHKVMTKRILEESTNYLFVLGVTKLVLNTKKINFESILTDNEYNFLDTEISNINDIKLRNKIIRIILTICSEIPAVKELGLLNSYNYYELDGRNKVYFSEIVKEVLNYSKTEIDNSISKIKKIDKKKLKNLFKIKDSILNKDYFKINVLKSEDKKAEKWKELQENLNKEINNIVKNKEYEGNEKNIIISFLKNLSEEKFNEIKNDTTYYNEYSNFLQIKEFIEELLSKSNIIKDLFQNSGINFKDKNLQNVLTNYEKNLENFNSDELLFDGINKEDSPFYHSIFEHINLFIQEVDESRVSFEEKYVIKNLNYDLEKIKKTFIYNNISDFFKFEYSLEEKSYDEIIEIKEKDTFNNTFLKITLKSNNSEQLKIITSLETGLNIENLEQKEKEYNIVISDDFFLKYEKNNFNIAKISNTFYDKLNTFRIDPTSLSFPNVTDRNKLNINITSFTSDRGKEYFNDYFIGILTSYTILNNKLNQLEIDNYYDKIRDFYKISQLYKLKKENDNQFSDELDLIFNNRTKNEELFKILDNNNKNGLIQKNSIYFKNKLLNYFKDSILTLQKLNEIKNLSNDYNNLKEKLNKLSEKIIVYSSSKTSGNGLFNAIKDILKNDNIFKLNNGEKFTDKENQTIKKLRSFFYNRNLNSKLNDLEILKFFNKEFYADLSQLSYKTKNTGKSISKLISTIEFSINNLIIDKTNRNKENQILFKNINNVDKLKDFLKFVGNIKELGQAETFEFLLKTMNDYEFLFRNANGKNKIIPDLINSLREYAIVDIGKNSIEIDVASVLTRILEKYQLNKNISFYASVGLNQYWAKSDLFDEEGQPYTEFSSASEKIGVKFKLWNFDRRYFNEDKLIHNIKKKSLVSDIYAMPYLSGLLYKIANTSGKNYDSTNFGVAFGLTFFNSLDFNFSYSIPLENDAFDKRLFGISFDFPLSEYLKRL